MGLPKIDTPVYEIELPISKKKLKFRPFLVKEQKNLLMAYEADDAETINNNIKQILLNCIIDEKIDIDEIPIVDIEYYFLQLRARSVGEIVDAKYRCNNIVGEGDTTCNNIMEASINVLDINITQNNEIKNIIPITETISVKLKYPRFSLIKSAVKEPDVTKIALSMVVDSIECIYDGEETHYAKDYEKEDLLEFLESLNQHQFASIEEFFENLPRLDKTVNIKCSKCGFDHELYFEGLESFFA